MHKVNLIGVFIAIAVVVIHHYWKIIVGIKKLLSILFDGKTHLLKYQGRYYSFCDLVEKKADERPDHVHVIMAETGEKRTLREIDILGNQIAHWAKGKGCKQPDSAALMLLNCVDYFSIWFGLSKLGVSTALLNTNVMGKAFIHSVETSLKSSGTKILILDAALQDSLKSEIEELQKKDIQIHIWGEKEFAKEINSQPSTRPDKSLRKNVKEADPLIFIFTSGTTGLPKACKISHTRYYMGASLYPVLADVTAKDIMYSAMPLYHSAAGLMATGGAIRVGATLVIRKKFSASNFTKDCLKYGVTSVQYIGELCRYLVNLPPNELDEKLRLKSAFGNGMRKEYWTKFQERYHVLHIVEFYAATEGNVGLFNCFDKVGPLGFVPKWLDFVYPLTLVKTDPNDQSVPLRDDRGYCILCAPNEPGLLLSEIGGTRRFEGYTDEKATNAKVLSDVFRKGDTYFNTGDLLSRDDYGYFYWSDRIGDTFRWKGENVSTTEVSEVISDCSSVGDVVVYGVEVPGTDGRAGMAAIVVKDGRDEIDFDELTTQLGKHLPPYARPLFIRLKADKKLPTTSTHKYIKTDLVKESFDSSKIGNDTVYYFDAKGGKYHAIDSQIFQKIQSEAIKF